MTERSKLATRQQNAAKCRRERENTVLVELSRLLPIPYSVAVRLDKASVVRLSTAYLKLRELFPNGIGKEWGERSQPDGILKELGTFLNTAFDGFVFVLGGDAKILYVSEAASTHLGLSQLELIGNSICNFIHEYDNSEVKKLMCHEQAIPALYSGSASCEDIEVPRNFEIRMKCTLPKKQAELAVDGYKVIHCRGYLKLKQKTENLDVSDPSILWYKVVGVVAVGHSLPSASIAEVKMHRKDFMFRTGLDLKFMYLEPRVEEIIGYEPSYLVDKSLYKFIHPWDCANLQEVHLLVLTRSQAVTRYYRFLTRGGGWIWIQSSCMIISSNKPNSQHYILILNHVLSGRECAETLLDVEQLDESRIKPSKSCDAFTKRTHKTKKKSSPRVQAKSPSNLHLLRHSLQNDLSVSPITMPVSGLGVAQGKLVNSAEFVKSNLESDLLQLDKNVYGANNIPLYSNLSNTFSPNNSVLFDNSVIYNIPPCPEFPNNISNYRNMCSSFMNHSLANVKCNIPPLESTVSSSVSKTRTDFNSQEAVLASSECIGNPCYQLDAHPHLESIKTNYLCDFVEGKEFASCCTLPLAAKKIKMSEPPILDSSTFVSYINTEQRSIIQNAHVPGNGEFMSGTTFHLKEANDEMLNYPSDQAYQFNNTSWNQPFNVNTVDQQHVNHFCVSHSSNNSAAEETPASKITDVKFIYSNDKPQKSLQDNPATCKNPVNFNMPQEFSNELPNSKQAIITTNVSSTPPAVNSDCFSSSGDHNRVPEEVSSPNVSETSNFDPSILNSEYNELGTSRIDDHLHIIENFPVFSDIVNLITNADIFPRLNTHETCCDLGFDTSSENNPSQLGQGQGQSSSNKAIYIN